MAEQQVNNETERDDRLSFEAVKIALTQDKNGYVLKLSINPVEVPDDLLRSWVGSRYAVAMLQIDDQEQIIPTQAATEANKAVQLAGILCKDPDFMAFFSEEIGSPIFNSEDCRDELCKVLGITSRKELKTNEQARNILYTLRDRFRGHSGGS